jgi:hypothetical protein
MDIYKIYALTLFTLYIEEEEVNYFNFNLCYP